MKKIFIIFTACLIVEGVVAQNINPDVDPKNKVTGVAGVKFGDNRAKAKQILRHRSQSILSSNKNTLECYNIEIGKIVYNHATFNFESEKGLIAAFMELPFPIWKKQEAIMLYKSIVYSYGAKYSNLVELIDGDEAKLSVCGAFDENYYPSMRPISIMFSKAMSQGGNMYYYITVSYFGLHDAMPTHDDI